MRQIWATGRDLVGVAEEAAFEARVLCVLLISPAARALFLRQPSRLRRRHCRPLMRILRLRVRHCCCVRRLDRRCGGPPKFLWLNGRFYVRRRGRCFAGRAWRDHHCCCALRLARRERLVLRGREKNERKRQCAKKRANAGQVSKHTRQNVHQRSQACSPHPALQCEMVDFVPQSEAG
jgi:hypothetical protein